MPYTWSPQGGSGVDKAVWFLVISSHGHLYGACKGGDKAQALMKQRSSLRCQGTCGHHVLKHGISRYRPVRTGQWVNRPPIGEFTHGWAVHQTLYDTSQGQ